MTCRSVKITITIHFQVAPVSTSSSTNNTQLEHQMALLQHQQTAMQSVNATATTLGYPPRIPVSNDGEEGYHTSQQRLVHQPKLEIVQPFRPPPNRTVLDTAGPPSYLEACTPPNVTCVGLHHEQTVPISNTGVYNTKSGITAMPSSGAANHHSVGVANRHVSCRVTPPSAISTSDNTNCPANRSNNNNCTRVVGTIQSHTRAAHMNALNHNSPSGDVHLPPDYSSVISQGHPPVTTLSSTPLDNNV